MGTDEGSFVPSATYHLTGDGDDLDRFDPDTAARQLPQPERRVTRVLNGVIGDAWAKIEERHPDVVVSLSGAQQKGRELETAAVATAVARPASNVTAARWGGDGPAPVLVVGTAAGQVLLYEPVATTGYVQDAESRATLVPFEALDAEDAENEKEEEDEEAEPAGPAAIGAVSAVSQREPNASCRVVVAAADDARVAVVEVYPSDCEEGPRLQLLTTIEAQSTASAVVLSRDGRWLAVASAENITLHRLPESMQQEEPAALGQISEEAAQEEFDASVAEIAKVAFVLPASGAVPTLHWVFATPMEATSLLVVKPDSHVVSKYGLRADAEDGGAPPLYAAWQMAANVSASCLLQDSDGTTSILALGLASGTVLLWDLQIDMCREVLKRHEKAVSALAVHRHKYLIAGAADGRVHIYDLAAGPSLSPQLIAVRSDLTAPVQDLACLRDAALAVARDGKGILALYDLARSALLGRLALGSGDRDDRAPAAAASTGADAVVASSETNDAVHVWAAHGIVLQLCPGVNAAAGPESDPLTILRLFARPDEPLPPPLTQNTVATRTSLPSRPGTGSRLGTASTKRSVTASTRKGSPTASRRASRSSRRPSREGDLFGELTQQNVEIAEREEPGLRGSAFVDPLDLAADAIADAAEGRVRREAALMHSLAAMAKAHAAAE